MATGRVSYGTAPQQVQAQQAFAADTRPDPTADFLVGLADKYVAGALAEKQQEMFNRGMQRAASGEALEEIKNDDPPFASIFGPSASVRGAMAMTQVQKVDGFVSSVYGAMPELAKMSPDEAGKRMMGLMQSQLTGDHAVDNVIQTRIMEQMPTLMKAQTKANYKYVQESMARSHAFMVDSAGTTIQAAAQQVAHGALSQEDFDRARGAALNSLAKPEGMSDDTYRANIKNLAINQMNKGNHWIDRWMNQKGPNGEPSFYESVLSVEDQTAIITARRTAENQTAINYGFNQYGAAIAELAGRSQGMSPAAIQQQVLAINKQYMDETGSEMGIITQQDAMQMVKGSYRRSFAIADKRAEIDYRAAVKEAGEAKKEAVEISRTVSMLAGGMGKFTVSAGVDKDKVDQIFSSAVEMKMAADDLDGAADLIVNNYNHGGTYINPYVQNLAQEPFRQAAGGGPIGEAWDQAQKMYGIIKSKPDGTAAADAYFGAENVVRMEQYNRFVAAGIGRLEAQQAVFGKPLIRGAKLTTKESQPLLMEALKPIMEKGGAGSWLRGVPAMDETNLAILSDAASQDMQLFVNNLAMSPKEAAKRAAPAIMRKVDVLGPVAIRKEEGQASLAEAIGSSQEDAGRALFDLMQIEAKRNGVNVPLGGWWETANSRINSLNQDAVVAGMQGGSKFTGMAGLFGTGSVRVQRLRDQGGLQVYHATVVTNDGQSAQFTFDSDQVKKHFIKYDVKKEQPLPVQ
jgi:hypothetical protein